jgi:hypothetical protein
MTPEEALDKANAIVTEWTAQVKNERGYVHDKWQPVDVATRTRAVTDLAGFLLSHHAAQATLVRPLPSPPAPPGAPPRP